MTQKKKTSKKTTKKAASKAAKKTTKKPAPAPKKVAVVEVKKAPAMAKVIPFQHQKKEIKKPVSFDEEAAFGEDAPEPTVAAAANPDAFLTDDFDTSRKEFEEGYLDEDDETDDSSDDEDVYSDDETSSFESYDDEFTDFEDEDEYGPGNFQENKVAKKKLFKDFDEE